MASLKVSESDESRRHFSHNPTRIPFCAHGVMYDGTSCSVLIIRTFEEGRAQPRTSKAFGSGSPRKHDPVKNRKRPMDGLIVSDFHGRHVGHRIDAHCFSAVSTASRPSDTGLGANKRASSTKRSPWNDIHGCWEHSRRYASECRPFLLQVASTNLHSAGAAPMPIVTPIVCRPKRRSQSSFTCGESHMLANTVRIASST